MSLGVNCVFVSTWTQLFSSIGSTSQLSALATAVLALADEEDDEALEASCEKNLKARMSTIRFSRF